MIGKLVVWKGDHRKDAPEKIRIGTSSCLTRNGSSSQQLGNGLGGFVPLDQLDDKKDVKPRSRSPSKAYRKVRARDVFDLLYLAMSCAWAALRETIP
jgi:hypothetical protein